MGRGKGGLRILLYDAGGARVGEYAPVEFPMPPECARALSVHFFGDPQPCAVHRAAVVTRAMEELMRGREAGVRYPVAALPLRQRRYFDPARVSAFAFEEASPP